MLYGEEPYISVGILTDKKIKFELYGDFSCRIRDNFSGVYSAELKMIGSFAKAANMKSKDLIK
jgi:hypothetical protein